MNFSELGSYIADNIKQKISINNNEQNNQVYCGDIKQWVKKQKDLYIK